MPMDVKTTLITGLANSLALLERYVADLSPQDMLHRPCGGANCAAWILGHLTLSERNFLSKLAPETMPALPEGFETRFGQGENAPKSENYGDTSRLLDIFREHRQALIAAVETLDPARLDDSTGIDHPFFRTYGIALDFMPIHVGLHAGQITIIRRSLGRPPLV